MPYWGETVSSYHCLNRSRVSEACVSLSWARVLARHPAATSETTLYRADTGPVTGPDSVTVTVTESVTFIVTFTVTVTGAVSARYSVVSDVAAGAGRGRGPS